jgi:hypothetical protein
MANGAVRAGKQAGRSETARKVVLFGWAAKGVVYLTLAYLVLQMAFGSAPQDASTTGALQFLASKTPGKVALVVLGLGLLAYAVGRILEVTTLAGPGIETKDKVEAGVLAFLYTALAITAFGVVGIGGGGGRRRWRRRQGAAGLGLPARPAGGRWLVGLLGLRVIAFGAYQAYKGVQQEFLPTLRTGEMPQGLRDATGKIGTAAYVTKGAILALLGYFFISSAVKYDPQEAKGLDAALQEVAQEQWGTVVLSLVALGLLAYAAFCFLESRYRRVGVSAAGTA